MPGSRTIWVDVDQELRRLCCGWKAETVLALDTEFERTRTFFARPALLQVSDGRANYLLDPLRFTDFSPLFEVLHQPGTLKVLHSASEDLELLFRLSGAPTRPIFDTQIAAALLGYGFSIGYRGLVMETFAHDLPKQETRSDWLTRPLSEAQCRYAALDVEYLLPIYHRLSDELRVKDRTSWIEEECDRLLVPERFEPDHHQAYRRIGLAWQLDRRQLGVLQALCAWREEEARRRDIPRRYVVDDPALMELARRIPRDLAGLTQVEGVSAKLRRRSGEQILHLIGQALLQPESALPEPISAPADLRTLNPELKRLKALVRAKAKALDIAPEMLGQRRALEELLGRVRLEGNPTLTPYFAGWRRSVIGDELLVSVQSRM